EVAALYTPQQGQSGGLAAAQAKLTPLLAAMNVYAASHPDNEAGHRLHSDMLARQVLLARTAGDLDAAGPAAQSALALAEARHKALPDDIDWGDRLSLAQRDVGELLIEQGRFADGLIQLRRSLALREELAPKEGGKANAQADVAGAQAALGDALSASGSYVDAETAYIAARNSLALQARLHPENKVLPLRGARLELAIVANQQLARRGLTASRTLKLLRQRLTAERDGGDKLLLAQAGLMEALIQPGGTAQQAYVVAERSLPALLADSEADPQNTYRQRESVAAWQKAGEIGLRAGQKDSACKYLGLAEARYDALAQAHRLNALDVAARTRLAAQRAVCRPA
ncbi:MAG: hypothetical protein ABIT83_01690, partial [Massilia sp.]